MTAAEITEDLKAALGGVGAIPKDSRIGGCNTDRIGARDRCGIGRGSGAVTESIPSIGKLARVPLTEMLAAEFVEDLELDEVTDGAQTGPEAVGVSLI